MKNLISMTDFVLEQKDSYYNQRFFKIENYANFLKQPLELWMFVPCDDDGNILEEPKHNWTLGLWARQKEYQQAKERCLFEGFEVKREFWADNAFVDYIQIGNDRDDRLFKSNNGNNWYLVNEYDLRIIEDLVKCNLQLTKTAEKLIGKEFFVYL